jgi:hypothetical protein
METFGMRKELYWVVGFWLVFAFFLVGSDKAKAQTTTFFNNQYGAPIGSATTMGNTTFYNNQYGAPVGTATNAGNTTFYNNQYGAPVGTATNTSPMPQQNFSQPNPQPFFGGNSR